MHWGVAKPVSMIELYDHESYCRGSSGVKLLPSGSAVSKGKASYYEYRKQQL
jgi:hypothetical protein